MERRRGGDEVAKSRLCEAKRAATTGCAYFMAATYHKSLFLMGECRSDDFKEITCRMRPTYTQPCRATQLLHAASKAAPNPLYSSCLYCCCGHRCCQYLQHIYLSAPKERFLYLEPFTIHSTECYKCGHKLEAVILKCVPLCDGRDSNYLLRM